MVSVNPNPAQGFFLFDPMKMGVGGLNSVPAATDNTVTATAAETATANSNSTASAKTTSSNTLSFADDPNKKIRKPYTITKSRESWTDQEHDKFLEALQLFDRDWKKIEAFIGSKTVIQIRSHAQKYFLKVQKNGTSEHVPPPRPKRKASHPYPQKAPKIAPVVSHSGGPFQTSSALLEPGFVYGPESSSVFVNPIPNAAVSTWNFNSGQPVSVLQVIKDDSRLAEPAVAQNCCYISSKDSTMQTRQIGETIDQGDYSKPMRVMPDFAQVYSFLGSVFDPNASGHIQRLKQMDPINFETVLMLMRNLATNLTSPEFEDHKKLLSLYDVDSERAKFDNSYNNLHAGNSQRAIPSV